MGEATLVVRDLVANLFHRLGMVGAIVLASALILGAVAGGVIVQRLDLIPSASSDQEQGAEAGEQAQEKDENSEKSEAHEDKDV